MSSILLMLLLLCGDIESQPGPNNLTREEFQQRFLSSKGMKIVHQNIRGILSNFDMLEEFLTSHNSIDIMALSETHLEDTNVGSCKINGYKFLYKNRTNGKGGGVAYYIKENITFERRLDLENSHTESIWIQINQKNSKCFLVGCFYKPPETSKYLQKNYNELLLNDLTRVLKQNNESIILGDFNINYNDSANGKNFKALFSQMGFKQLIKTSTRITQQSNTLIDLLFTNQPSKISTKCVVSTSLSDHDMIACTRKLNSQKFPPKTITSRNFSRYNIADVINDVSNIDWQPLYQSSDVSKALDYFTSSLKNVFDLHAPITSKRVKGKGCPWMTIELKSLMNTRDQLLRKARKSNVDDDWSLYRRIRNQCTNKIRKAKANFHRNLLQEYTVEPKKFWSVIKSLFPTKSTVSENSNLTVSDLKTRVTRFSNYFREHRTLLGIFGSKCFMSCQVFVTSKSRKLKKFTQN